MSENQLNAFRTKFKNDTALQGKLKGARSATDIAAVAQKEGFDVTGAELLRHHGKKLSSLSDSELEKTAAGGGTFMSFCAGCFTDPNSSRGCVC